MEAVKRFFMVFFVLLAMFCLPCSANQVRPEVFTFADRALSGYLISARGQEDVQRVAIIVHGDGALPYDANGYYQPIWDRLIRAGYTVFSWDKPGVGQSEGQWLQQSMLDRQAEVQSAIDHLKARFSLEDRQIGLVGFSQAGWVVPSVAKQNQDLCFALGMGFALNWMQQSWYMTERRMQSQGRSREQLAIAYQRHLDELVFFNSEPSYAEYRAEYGRNSRVMSRERFQFVLLNYQEDAVEDYIDNPVPFLLVFGEFDQNVDAVNTYQTLQALREYPSTLQIHFVDNATHALLEYPRFDAQNLGFWFWLRFSMNPEGAFAHGFLDQIEQWVRQRTEDCIF